LVSQRVLAIYPSKMRVSVFYDTMFIKVYEISNEGNFISRLRVVLLTPNPLGVIVNKPQGKQNGLSERGSIYTVVYFISNIV